MIKGRATRPPHGPAGDARGKCATPPGLRTRASAPSAGETGGRAAPAGREAALGDDGGARRRGASGDGACVWCPVSLPPRGVAAVEGPRTVLGRPRGGTWGHLRAKGSSDCPRAATVSPGRACVSRAESPPSPSPQPRVNSPAVVFNDQPGPYFPVYRSALRVAEPPGHKRLVLRPPQGCERVWAAGQAAGLGRPPSDCTDGWGPAGSPVSGRPSGRVCGGDARVTTQGSCPAVCPFS